MPTDVLFGWYNFAVQVVNDITLNDVLEWSGNLFGLLGSLMLATNSRFSRQGWFCFSLRT